MVMAHDASHHQIQVQWAFDRQGQAAKAVAYGEPDPQNARPERSYLELQCCLLVFIEENRDK